MIMKIDQEKQVAVASLRWPDYFSVIDMLKSAWDMLIRFGGHRWAGWLTVKLENLDKLIKHFNEHCEQCISDDNIIKSIQVDTKIYEQERDNNTLTKIDKLAPFGKGNEEPIFLLENVSIQKIEKVGTKGKCHLKIHGTFGKKKITTMFLWRGDEVEELIARHGETPVALVGKIRKDTFNGWFYLEWADIR